MHKERILIVAAVLIMAGLGAYAARHVTKPVVLTVATQTVHEENTSPAALINAEYPVITGFKLKPEELALNQAIKKYTDDAVASFKEDIHDAIPIDQEPYQRSEFSSKYEIGVVTSTLVSVRFSNFMYSAGAAHPLSYVDGFNYDVSGGKPIALQDLFIANSPYLEHISEKAIADLKVQFKDDLESLAEWIDTGAAPKNENYQTFIIKPEGLLVIFSPYQVGPYVIGTPEVLIKYSDLRDILNPNGPVSIFMSSTVDSR
jgi:hypothetical protein